MIQVMKAIAWQKLLLIYSCAFKELFFSWFSSIDRKCRQQNLFLLFSVF